MHVVTLNPDAESGIQTVLGWDTVKTALARLSPQHKAELDPLIQAVKIALPGNIHAECVKLRDRLQELIKSSA